MTTSVPYSSQLACFAHLSKRIKCSSRSNTMFEGQRVLALKRDYTRLIMAATQIDSNATSRPLANFHPCVWGDRFQLSDYEYDQLNRRDEELSPKVEALTQELKLELKEANEYPLKQLELIDTIQRLGIGYLFEREIDQALQSIYDNYLEFYKSNKDLYNVALSFRLLRQQGYKVSCECFEKFVDVNGEFEVSLTSHVMGMLEFYEATYLSIQGEDVLDHGRAFTRAHLHSILPHISDSSIREQVLHALDYSNRREVSRLSARSYISVYEQRAIRHEKLLQLAKLDFNRVQILHKKEISELFSWWKWLNVQNNFWFTRDRCVEIYFWGCTTFFEPQYSTARKHVSKASGLISIIDDMFDAYGTFEEVKLFNEALQSWRFPSSDSLPDYLKVLYGAIDGLFEEIDEEMVKLKVEYRTDYAKKALKLLVQGYFNEAAILKAKHEPGIEEYMIQGRETTAYIGMPILASLHMGPDVASKSAFDWMLTNPPIIKAASDIARLTTDIAAHEFEREREHIVSVVECYMKEHGVSKQETLDELNHRIDVAWKDINEAMLGPTVIPVAILDRVLNLARVMESMYKKGDWYTHVSPQMQDFIKQLFIDPVPE